MKFAPMILLLLVACGTNTPPKPPVPTIQVAAAGQFGHLSVIRLPEGEYWDGWLVTPGTKPGGSGAEITPEKYFFATTTVLPRNYNRMTGHTHTLRTAQGTPVLIVKD